MNGWMDGWELHCVKWHTQLCCFKSETFLAEFLLLLCLSEMAELLFYMEKLRGLMKKYNYVVQRYHVQYLAQFDALVLNDTIQVSTSNDNGHLFVRHGLEKEKKFLSPCLVSLRPLFSSAEHVRLS